MSIYTVDLYHCRAESCFLWWSDSCLAQSLRNGLLFRLGRRNRHLQTKLLKLRAETKTETMGVRVQFYN